MSRPKAKGVRQAMASEHVVCQWSPTPNGPRVRVVVEGDANSQSLELVRRGQDIFFLTPEAEVVAALVRVGPDPAPAPLA